MDLARTLLTFPPLSRYSEAAAELLATGILALLVIPVLYVFPLLWIPKPRSHLFLPSTFQRLPLPSPPVNLHPWQSRRRARRCWRLLAALSRLVDVSHLLPNRFSGSFSLAPAFSLLDSYGLSTLPLVSTHRWSRRPLRPRLGDQQFLLLLHLRPRPCRTGLRVDLLGHPNPSPRPPPHRRHPRPSSRRSRRLDGSLRPRRRSWYEENAHDRQWSACHACHYHHCWNGEHRPRRDGAGLSRSFVLSKVKDSSLPVFSTLAQCSFYPFTCLPRCP
jgi:hypothetical protein